jgi:hypothetical protein
MNTTVMATQVGPPSHAKNHLDNPAPPSRPVILPLTLEHVRRFIGAFPSWSARSGASSPCAAPTRCVTSYSISPTWLQHLQPHHCSSSFDCCVV